MKMVDGWGLMKTCTWNADGFPVETGNMQTRGGLRTQKQNDSKQIRVIIGLFPFRLLPAPFWKMNIMGAFTAKFIFSALQRLLHTEHVLHRSKVLFCVKDFSVSKPLSPACCLAPSHEALPKLFPRFPLRPACCLAPYPSSLPFFLPFFLLFPFLPSFLPPFLPSSLPSSRTSLPLPPFLPFFLPSFFPSASYLHLPFLPQAICTSPSFLPSFLPPFLPPFLPSLPLPPFLPSSLPSSRTSLPLPPFLPFFLPSFFPSFPSPSNTTYRSPAANEKLNENPRIGDTRGKKPVSYPTKLPSHCRIYTCGYST